MIDLLTLVLFGIQRRSFVGNVSSFVDSHDDFGEARCVKEDFGGSELVETLRLVV